MKPGYHWWNDMKSVSFALYSAKLGHWRSIRFTAKSKQDVELVLDQINSEHPIEDRLINSEDSLFFSVFEQSEIRTRINYAKVKY